ncbi:hypothetical protein [Streptomyces sp. CBMA29]|uniref:hypothetical protein n=1 Tax=Streptomyces sp. CBMA29 TaxID=1896314 RepID=UPI0016619573|nr:hypothetical protein [Streptomyces sp. CBMA29]MBD0739824.1 hypothetical protein [Streptomyces sp. CBMA29]
MQFTRDQVSEAVNGGADLVIGALSLGEQDSDAVNLVANAIMTRLENPDADFSTVIADNYASTEEEVRSWWSDWS